MAIDISIRNRADLRNEDQRWIGNGGQPLAAPRPIVLRRASFNLTATFPNGFIPSGIALARITATGLYVPYSDAGEAGAPGTGILRGHLFVSAVYDRDSTADIAAALFWNGEVIENYLPTGHGLDAAGRADVAGWITYTTNVV